jgi:cytidine deaminase
VRSAKTTLDAAAKKALLADARRAMGFAHAPYSKVKVGAAILAKGGRVHLGASIGNASSALNACAEQTATGCAVMAGDREFSAIAVVRSEGGACVPCGRCLQLLSEFADGLAILTEDGDGAVVEWTLRGLLPVPYRRP